jgi:uncharacterized repeat protein (TIGR01451 family)
VLRANPLVATVELDRSRTAEATPSDVSYGDQWALPKIGWDQAFGVVDPAGSAVVAVLDTGVDASHPDLDGNIVAGTSFVAGSSWSTDANGHGTAMAGIVAAETNNGAGVAGVGYAGVSVMPVTVLGPDGSGSDSDIIEGVVWAADHGADVILMSFSATGYSSALQAAVDYAWSHGVVLVAAAGNDGSSANTFPAGDAGVIGVSATDQNDALAAFSNYGESVFLGAPGTSITALGGSISGTSAAAAHVAGAAGLLAAADGTASNGLIVGRLARNADAAGTAAQTGNGRLNLARALNDTSTGGIKPAGAEPGDGGPFVGPYVAVANNDGHVAPQWAPGSATTTFNVLYRVTTGGIVQHVKVTLPVDYTDITPGATAFSSGTWGAPTVSGNSVSVALTSGTGLAVGGWARIDITATTPASQNGNAAKWLLETFTNTAGTTGQQDDEPAVLVNNTTDPSATITFRDPVSGALIPTPVLEDEELATLAVRITQSGSGIKYIDLAIPTCFSPPSNITTTSSAGGNGGYTIIVTDNFLRLSGGSIPADGFLTVKFDTTPDCVSGTYVVSTSPSTNATNPPSTTNQSVSTTGGSLSIAAGLADLSITKTDSPDPVATSGTLTYTIGVTNAGPDPASAVKVVDTLPAGTTFSSATGTDWNCVHVSGTVTCNRTAGNLPVGAAPNITIVVTTPGTTGSITNSATVSSPNDNLTGNNTATATTTVGNRAISLSKTANPTTYAGAGQSITYSYVVTNTGTLALAGPVTVSDDKATVTCPNVNTVGNNNANLDPGESITCTATYVTTAADVTAKSVTNTATATVDGTNSNQATATINLRALTIDKTSVDTTYSAVGDVLDYSFKVTNSGNVTLSGPFTVADDKATNELCPATASLAPNAFITCTASYTVTQADLDAGSVTNTATASNGTTTSPSDSLTINATQVASLELTKSATPATYSAAGQIITYTFVVDNTGNVTLSGVAVSDPHCDAAPANASGDTNSDGKLDVTETWIFTCLYTVTQADVNAGSITNTATATASGPQDQQASDTDSVTIRVVIGSTSQMTNSAFQLVDDLTPWAVSDFEVLVNGQNIVVATNPGQFYYHQRATSPYSITTSWDFKLEWPCQFESQINGGQPIHAYIQYATDALDTWRPWGESNSVINTPFPSGCNQATGMPYGSGTITVNNVPAGATVWVNVHLDYAAKGDNISTLTPNPMTKPVTYRPFSSKITMRSGSVVVGTSYSETSVIGRGKKVTMAYGTLTNKSTGLAIEDTWVRISQGTSNATVLTGADGFYVLYDGQACVATDGIAGGCKNGTATLTTWNFANGSNVATTIRILGTEPTPATPTIPAAGAAPAYPTGMTSAEVKVNTWTAKNPPSYDFNVAKGSGYSRDWRFTP